MAIVETFFLQPFKTHRKRLVHEARHHHPADQGRLCRDQAH